MKIIDFDRKGNVVRFYLGKDDLDNWYGDDWDDAPYEYNAGTVYNDFISGTKDIAFPFDSMVLEPSCGTQNSWFCKDDMKERRVPCLIVVPKEVYRESCWDDSFSRYVGADGIEKYYFGDKMEADDGEDGL